MSTYSTMKRVTAIAFLAAIYSSLLISPSPAIAADSRTIVFDYSHGQYKPTLVNTTDLWLKNKLWSMGYTVVWALGGINASILSNAVAFVAGPIMGVTEGYTAAELTAIANWFNAGNKFMWIGYDSDFPSATTGQFILNNMTAILSRVGSHVYGEPTGVQDAISNCGAVDRVVANKTGTNPYVAPCAAGISKVLMHSPTLLFGSDSSSPGYDVSPIQLETNTITNVYPLLYYGASANIVDSDLIPPKVHNDNQTGSFVATTLEIRAGTTQSGVLVVSGGSQYGQYQPMCTDKYYGVNLDGGFVKQVISFGITQATTTTMTSTTTTTTTTAPAPEYTLYTAILTFGIGAVIGLAVLLGTYFVKFKPKSKHKTGRLTSGEQAMPAVEEETISEAPSAEEAAVTSTEPPEAIPLKEAIMSSPVAEMGVEALRGGEFVGNRFRFKVKVANNSKYIVSDVMVALLSYPKDSLRLDGDSSKSIPRIDPEGFRSPTFEFTPTQDCVKGNLAASVSFIDYQGQPHSLVTRPFTVRAVCDLLIPETITAEAFQLRLSSLQHGDQTVEIKEWTPEEMHAKTADILRNSNFYKVTSESRKVGEYVEARVSGWAKGKYTGKDVGVQIIITGKPGIKGAKCRIRMSGEDEAMLMPAIDEIAQKLNAWLCPRCGGALPAEAVKCLKSGKSACCPFCGVTMDR